MLHSQVNMNGSSPATMLRQPLNGVSMDRKNTAKGAGCGPKVKQERAKMVVIRGVVIPMDWDDQGNVVQIAISSHDEMEYMVEKKGKGDELLAFIRKEVEVGGEIKEKDDRRIIRIKRYRVM